MTALVPRVNCKLLAHNFFTRIRKILVKIIFLYFPVFSASEYLHFVLIFIDSLNHPRFFNHYSNDNTNETSYESITEAYSERCQSPKMEIFAKIVIGF